MASPQEPQKGALDDSTRKPMPFEPKNRKSSDSQPSVKPAAQKDVKKAAASSPRPKKSRAPRAESGIPEEVSRRMIQRMGLFSGVPSFFGMSTFVISYWLVTQDIYDLPTYAVLFVSLGWFGLGVVGLTYGVLSASWEEGVLGSKLGIEEFKVNWERMAETWRENSRRNPRPDDD